MGKIILVTGAAGFIGGHLVETLLGRGYSVICLVHPRNESSLLDRLNVKLIRCDLGDCKVLKTAVMGVDEIYHLAGVLYKCAPEVFYATNHQGTIRLVAACREVNPALKRFVFVSSASVSGPTGDTRFKEGDTCKPVNDYAKSKLQTEHYLLSSQNVLPTTILRPVQVYGPRALNSMLSLVCKLAGKKILPRLQNGYVSLGYVHDIVRGMIQACEHPQTEGKVYHIGDIRPYPIREIIETFSSAVRADLIRLRVPYLLLYGAAALTEFSCNLRKIPPPLNRWMISSYVKDMNWCYDISKAQKEFRYRPEFSLGEGAKLTVDWLQRAGHLVWKNTEFS